MRSVLSALSIACVLAACSSQSTGPCTGSPNGRACVQDTECCSGYCMLESGGSYCQDKPKVPPSCVIAQGYCTQDRNCCDGLCQANMCFGTPLPPGSCLEVGSDCAQPSDCCSGNCQASVDNTPVCVLPDRDPDAGACLPGGGTCLGPGDCCTGVCVSMTCAGHSGGGGPNCGGAGSTCRYGADCCSQQCVKVTSGSQCK